MNEPTNTLSEPYQSGMLKPCPFCGSTEIYAYEHGKGCHVGRIGPIQRMLLCELAGADSIDATTWVQVRGGVDRYIGGYKSQRVLDVQD